MKVDRVIMALFCWYLFFIIPFTILDFVFTHSLQEEVKKILQMDIVAVCLIIAIIFLILGSIIMYTAIELKIRLKSKKVERGEVSEVVNKEEGNDPLSLGEIEDLDETVDSLFKK